MSSSPSLKLQYGARVAALAGAVEREDAAAFDAALDGLFQDHQPQLVGQLSQLTSSLQLALNRFQLDSRLSDLASRDIPDARHRLAHVLKMTDEAAHKTLDLVEQSGLPADRIARTAGELGAAWTRFRNERIPVGDFCALMEKLDAFLPAAGEDARLIQRNLTEVLLTQGYQDLTGQIIRGVMTLVEEIETILARLPHAVRAAGDAAADSLSAAPAGSRGFGPVIPGVTLGEVATGQQDVDALLSGLGM